MNYRTLLPSALALVFLLSGCEGGKPRAEQCYEGARAPYNQCEQAAPQEPTGCGPGLVEVEGRCEVASDCPTGQHEENGSCVDDQLTVELVSQTACYIDDVGAVQLIVQYTAQDQDGRNPASAPGAPEGYELQTSIFVDGRPLDVEAQIERESELLQSDLVVSLVLDASYSMLEHEPPAFEPMKTAAMDILRATANLWQATDSDFHWELLWFDSLLYMPLENMAGESWTIDDIAAIPEPPSGRFTALYKAIDKMVNTHAQLRESGIAAGPRDQHVMLVFSDGADNQGHVDNSGEENVTEHNLNNMLYWAEMGGPSITLPEVKASVAEAANLRTYVIGFGESVDSSVQQSLEEIATSGRGKFFYGRETSSLEELFREVQTEFVTLQTIGVRAPLAGEHTFSLVVADPLTGAEGRRDITIDAGPELGQCEEAE